MAYIVTTTQSIETADSQLLAFSNDSGFKYVPRHRSSMHKLVKEHQAEGIVVWEEKGPILYAGEDKFFFHPSMAKNRIASFRKNDTVDLMVKASKLARGDDFLDCTLGLGADSIVASYFSETGRVTGLESEKIVAYMVKWGMKRYHGQMTWMNEAIERIQVRHTDHLSFLQNQADDSYDIVYFDPMFQNPLQKSNAISPLRGIANHQALEEQSIREACRVARKTVVMKERLSGDEFARLGFHSVVGSSNKKIGYGVISIQ